MHLCTKNVARGQHANWHQHASKYCNPPGLTFTSPPLRTGKERAMSSVKQRHNHTRTAYYFLPGLPGARPRSHRRAGINPIKTKPLSVWRTPRARLADSRAFKVPL